MRKFSIIIPIFNESESIAPLVKEIFSCLKKYNSVFELIIVDDKSTDNSIMVINELKNVYRIILIKNDYNLGQSFATLKGIEKSKYDTIVTLDGDGQNNPQDINKLLNIYFEKKIYDLVSGIRINRKDSLIKIISSKIANKFRSLLLQDNCKDTGCSLKVFNKNTFLKFPYFDGLHRFLPALFKGYGKRTFFVDVSHRPRYAGSSKYDTFGRLIKGLRDLIKVWFIIKKFKNNI